MKRFHASFAFYASAAMALGVACSPSPLPDPPVENAGTSGTGATGGSATGGVGNVGNVGNTGNAPSGGTGNVSGSVGKGGAGGAGGTAGGAAGSTAGTTGGTVANGGTSGTGVAGTGVGGTGVAGGGAAGSTAGSAGTGTAGSAGTGTVCTAPWDVNSSGFVRAQAMGGACWSGYAFAGADMLGSMATPTNFEECGMPCMLCFGGTVVKNDDYASTAFIGFNIGQPASGGTEGSITPTGTGLTVTFSNGTGTPLRLQIANGDSAAQRWCADITTSPAQVPYTSFNTTCWAPTTGTAYSKTPIKAIQIIVPGDAAADREFDVCINSVAEY